MVEATVAVELVAVGEEEETEVVVTEEEMVAVA